jgi:hypothetical protein
VELGISAICNVYACEITHNICIILSQSGFVKIQCFSRLIVGFDADTFETFDPRRTWKFFNELFETILTINKGTSTHVLISHQCSDPKHRLRTSAISNRPMSNDARASCSRKAHATCPDQVNRGTPIRVNMHSTYHHPPSF